ncbi:MAG TPA: envelope stress response membrane protein PspC [Sphingomicrobium sp.]|jgi:phage shock protein C|nr:envelope stress response membrane protein PspC [Sphingomicrobium sp.]
MTPDKRPPNYRPPNQLSQRFCLNKRDGKILGVCAGFADYVGVDVTLVRIGMVVATVLSGGMTLPLYLAAGLLAPSAPADGANLGDAREPVRAAPDLHSQSASGAPSHTRFYRDKAQGKFMGVCAGIADYTGVDVSLVRVCFIAGVFLSGGTLLLPYLIAGLITPAKPKGWETHDQEHKEFWQGVRASPARAARDLHSRLRDINRRLADIESYVTTENRSLAREIEQLR